MAHELDMTSGAPAIAYVGETPWHGLGSRLTGNETMDQWRIAAGLDWFAQTAPVQFYANGEMRQAPDRLALYRTDTANLLGVVSPSYHVVQPREIVDFYKELCEKRGYTMETAGALKGGRVVWALAKTPSSLTLPGDDRVDGYLLLTTSYDKTLATQARFTAIRVVCNNTLTIAVNNQFAKGNNKAGRAIAVKVNHSTKFKENDVKDKMFISEQWHAWSELAAKMAKARMDAEQTAAFFLSVYHDKTLEDLNDADERSLSTYNNTLYRLGGLMRHSPGGGLESSTDTLWGAVNAVTRDVDFSERALSDDSRLTSAWFGSGENRKNKAWGVAQELLAA